MANDSIPLKRCSRKEKCVNPLGSWLPATREYFAKESRNRDGHRSCCRKCDCLRSKTYAAAHPQQVAAARTAYYDANAKKLNAKSRQWRAENADRIRDYNRQYRLQHVDYERTRQRKYALEHPLKRRHHARLYVQRHPDKVAARRHRRRALEYGAEGAYTRDDLRLQIKSQTDKKGRLKCWWCGTVISEKYHIDHRIPLSRGGSNNADNLVISHAKCNQSKNNKLPSEWADRLL